MNLQKHLTKIEEAKKNLEGIINKTLLIKSPFFSNESNNNIYIKPENLQFTGSFKIRGAYNRIVKLSQEKELSGIIASSAGNHAQGVAYSCKKLGIKAIIVMPTITPINKVNATKQHGAEVILYGDVYDDAYNYAIKLSKELNYEFVHPFDDYDVVYGQGTIGLEIYEELDQIDEILIPIGGGGLISGIALALKALNPNIKITGVEPVDANAMKKSLRAGKIVSLDNIKTSAEGVAVKTPGSIPYEISKDLVDDIILVTEEDINEAVLLLLEQHKIVAEGAGALSIAALKYLNSTDKNIVSLISGGNIDVVTVSSVINSGLINRGRILGFAVDLPDTPGQLLKISTIIANVGANVIQLEHNQFKARDRFASVRLEVTLETNGHDHIEQIIKELEINGFEITRIY